MRQMRLNAISLVAAILVVVSPAATWASDEEHKAADHHHAEEAEHEEHGEHGHGGRGLKHPNEVAIFLGDTEKSGNDSAFTWGLDYKRRVADGWAVGLIFDYAGGDLRNYILAPSVSFWPGLGNLQLLAAAGVEFHDGRDDGDVVKSGKAHAGDTDHSNFLVRLGLGYDFHLPKGFGIVPNINLDFVDDHEIWVWGVNFTYGF